jgi:homoserine O-acetyltransferase/O-succinyltransferase
MSLNSNLRVLALSCISFGLWAQDQQSATLGDFKLKNGETIRELKVGYRTFGSLNSDKSNAILFPTWFTGTTKNLVDLIGPGKLIDSGKYFVIAVDALGDGVSSSPSNSTSQAHMSFPKFSTRDMVESHYLLLTSHFQVNHLKAVMGVSMGGMQTFEWMVAYPNFMDYAIPIVGSPKLTSYDLLLWNTEAHAIDTDPTWKNGDYSQPPAGMRIVADIHALGINTPEYWVKHVPPSELPAKMSESEKTTAAAFDCNDWLRQLQAMIGHDISQGFGGDMAKAAAAVRARTLVVVGTQDHMVNPHPALEFAKLIKARTLELADDCGHTSPNCDMAKVAAEIAALLETK